MRTDTVRAATSEDWPRIARLLADAALPLDGAQEHLGAFVVAERGGSIIGCAALERHGAAALLRSVAVDSTVRGEGIGERLVTALIFAARQERLGRLALLTTTAAAWFPRFGFRRIGRDVLASTFQSSAEFRGACPSTAIPMVLDLSA